MTRTRMQTVAAPDVGEGLGLTKEEFDDIYYYDSDEGSELFESGALVDEAASAESGSDEEEDHEGGPLSHVFGPLRSPDLEATRQWEDQYSRRSYRDDGTVQEQWRRENLESFNFAAPRREAEEGVGVLSGFFEKKLPQWVNGWRTHHYMLRSHKLLYYLPRSLDRPLGILDFNLLRYELHCCWKKKGTDQDHTAHCSFQEEGGAARQNEQQASPSSEKGFRGCCCCDHGDEGCSMAPLPKGWRMFYLRPKAFRQKVFCFRGPGVAMESLSDRLLSLIIQFAALSPSPQISLQERTVVSTENFWRYPFIDEREFSMSVESGDLLLFQGSDRAAQIQRTATGADYDHVGLALCVPGGELWLLEACGGSGVAIVPWRFFRERKWNEFYPRVACRKVYFARTDEQMLALRSYVESVLGNPYGLSMGKLFGRTLSDQFDQNGKAMGPRRDAVASNGRGDVSRDAQEREGDEEGPKRSFFCSELVAACLKRCGVLAGARASSSYWPGSFSSKSRDQLPLQEGAYLGEEHVVLFG